MKPRWYEILLLGIFLALLVVVPVRSHLAAKASADDAARMIASAALFNQQQAAINERLHFAQAAVKRAADYVNAHPNPNTAEIDQMNELNSESNRLMAEVNKLNAELNRSLQQRIKLSAPLVSSPVDQYLPWALLVSFWMLLALSYRRSWERKRNRKRVRQHICVHCGYDLHATPGQCPECGQASANAHAST